MLVKSKENPYVKAPIKIRQEEEKKKKEKKRDKMLLRQRGKT